MLLREEATCIEWLSALLLDKVGERVRNEKKHLGRVKREERRERKGRNDETNLKATCVAQKRMITI